MRDTEAGRTYTAWYRETATGDERHFDFPAANRQAAERSAAAAVPPAGWVLWAVGGPQEEKAEHDRR